MAIDVNISTQFIKDTDTPTSYIGQATKKLVVKADESGLEFVADTAGDTNIMNTNLTANANRTQDLNSFSMYFNNGKQFKWLNNVAPTIGEGSFDLQAYGTTSSDIITRLKNGASTEVLKIDGKGNYYIGAIGNTGARLGVKGIDDSASTYLALFQNLSGSNAFIIDNDCQVFINRQNLKFFKFGNDNYIQTEGGVTYHRGNGFGYFNISTIGGINFESTNFGGGQAHSSAKVQIESTTQGFRLVPMTATQASAITPVEGLELNVSNTNGTFTSIGKWQYIGGAWVKL